ncbi:type VI secretion system ATPase TssH [Thalassobaculum sp.]|uniref:type VI secretion system ATPase TssH n=1 Tax=Thalassobaculum sp. TaxID=2022740 RepID=UPI0032EC9E69
MISVELKPLLGRLNPYTKKALEAAAGLCVSRTNYEVTVEHVLLTMVDDTERDFQLILRHSGIEPAHLKRELQREVEGRKTGNTGRPVFSPVLIEWISSAWLLGSVELGLGQIRSGLLIVALLADRSRFGGGRYMDLLDDVNVDELRRKLLDIVDGSKEESAAMGLQKPTPGGDGKPGAAAGISEDSAIGRFCINVTEQARSGKIDPVFARDREMRLIVDILGRRRKNNPIAVGEPGVGKSAIVEGLALKIVEGDVPEFMQNVELLSLDLGLLQAGAGVKGEFENRLRGVIDEVKASPKPIVLFIDEAHTLIGAGGTAGGSDAANLLKPALARGELRTIAATTWSEYKKYFEKDPALTRRFQLVKLDEPSPDDAVTIMRGIRGIYEGAHGVYIRDDAVSAAAHLSARYISGRQLPDKSVDVLDTASARVKLSQSAKPAVVDDAERRIATLKRELEAVERDLASDNLGSDDRVAELNEQIAKVEAELVTLGERWSKERALVDRVLALRAALHAKPASDGQEPVADAGSDDEASGEEPAPVAATPAVDIPSDPEEIRRQIDATRAELATLQGYDPLVHYEVTSDSVAQVIADWTGVPLGSMVRDEAKNALGFAESMKVRIKGQDDAIAVIDQGIRAAKAGLNNPNAPMGVFLFVGSSGVGKTETATAVADQMFGGERFMISINMSEFQEKHTVSRLVGSPPGYVGYGEGGVLTEAVRQRPYSVVLLDEVEKADLEVMNLFYQVFDKGTLSDGEGREIDFKNTIVFLTSNLATDIITELGMRDPKPSVEELTEAIRPQLSHHFKPALLARMQIVPFFPLKAEALGGIVRLKLNKVGDRLRSSQKMRFEYTDAVVEQITQRCTEVETGARNIDHIINRTLLPEISTEILQRLGDEQEASALKVGIAEGGSFTYDFEA